MNAPERKNILQIFASPTWGGGEQYVLELSGKLLSEGYRVHLVSRKSDVIPKKTSSLGCPLVQLPLKGHFDLFSVLKIKRMIDAEAIDVIHTHQFKDTFVALFARMLSKRKPKVVFTRHLVKRAKKNILYAFLYRKTDKIIFISRLARDEFLSSRPHITEKKITVIHNSIPPHPLAKTDRFLRETYPARNETLILAYTGRLVPEKGVDVLIDAVRIARQADFIVLIAGTGTPAYEKHLKEKVASSGLDNKIFFTGFIEDIPGFIRQTDIGIAPSVWREPFGLTVIEFMQAGKAVVSTDNGAQKEFVSSGENGILVPPSDPQALASAIEKLIGDEEFRLRIGRNARQKVNNDLSYETFFRKITDVYNET